MYVKHHDDKHEMYYGAEVSLRHSIVIQINHYVTVYMNRLLLPTFGFFF